MQVEPAFNIRTFVGGQSKDSSVNSVKPGGLLATLSQAFISWSWRPKLGNRAINKKNPHSFECSVEWTDGKWSKKTFFSESGSAFAHQVSLDVWFSGNRSYKI